MEELAQRGYIFIDLPGKSPENTVIDTALLILHDEEAAQEAAQTAEDVKTKVAEGLAVAAAWVDKTSVGGDDTATETLERERVQACYASALKTGADWINKAGR